MYRVLEIKDDDGCYLEAEVTKQGEILIRVTDEEDQPAAAILNRKMALGLVRWLSDQGVSLVPEEGFVRVRRDRED